MNKPIRLAALLALAAFALPASAKTYYVNAKTGNDANTGLSEGAAFKTIQKAIDKAAAGSTILVAPGTYAPIRMKKKLTIKATEGADKTIIDGSLGEKYVPVPFEVPDWVEVEEWDGQTYYSYYDEESEEYHNWLPPDDETIWLAPAPKARKWKEVWKSGSYKYVRWFEERVGEVRCTDACVMMGTLSHKRRTSLYYESNNYGTNFVSVAASVSGFTVKNARKGIWGGNASYCTVTGITGMPVAVCSLSDSVIEDNDAIGMFDTSGSLVSASTLNRCEISGNRIETSCEDNILGISDSLILGGIGSYFWKGGAFNSIVTGNNVSGDYALCAVPAYNCTFVGNTISDGNDGATVLDDVFNCIVWGNRTPGGDPANVRLATDDKTGATIASDYMNRNQWNEWSESYETYYAYNTMMNSDVEGVVIEQKGNKGKWYKNSTGNISADPLFIDPENGDYHLSPMSPCKDAGADYQSKTGKFDLDSGARKVGKVDLGAYELQPQTAVPADYDGDGITDAAFYFAASGQWWIFQSGSGGIRTVTLPDKNATPCPFDDDGDGKAEIAYYTAAEKKPNLVVIYADGFTARTTFGEKGATPVAVRLANGETTFGIYTANAKKPAFTFTHPGVPKVEFGAKASRPVVADFDKDGKDDLGVYTATASKPAFSILQSSKGFSTANLFQGGPVALGAKGAIPCCADFDKDGKADFGVYLSNTKAPYFTRLPSSTKYRETWTLPMGSKGDAPVVGVYESGKPAAPAVWTGSKWTYLKSDFTDVDLFGE